MVAVGSFPWPSLTAFKTASGIMRAGASRASSPKRPMRAKRMREDALTTPSSPRAVRYLRNGSRARAGLAADWERTVRQAGPRGVFLERTVMPAAGKRYHLRNGVAHHPAMRCGATRQPEIGSWAPEVPGGSQVSRRGGLVVCEDPQSELSAHAGWTLELSLLATHTGAAFYCSSHTSYRSGIEILMVEKSESRR
jgi:hypothetical protein